MSTFVFVNVYTWNYHIVSGKCPWVLEAKLRVGSWLEEVL